MQVMEAVLYEAAEQPAQQEGYESGQGESYQQDEESLEIDVVPQKFQRGIHCAEQFLHFRCLLARALTGCKYYRE
jgi:hypothetical protein